MSSYPFSCPLILYILRWLLNLSCSFASLFLFSCASFSSSALYKWPCYVHTSRFRWNCMLFLARSHFSEVQWDISGNNPQRIKFYQYLGDIYESFIYNNIEIFCFLLQVHHNELATNTETLTFTVRSLSFSPKSVSLILQLDADFL